ncbi:MAG TPA: hypothetical protein PLE28_00320 [bacterium]|nr:hypothetical protein [bacterium]
MNQANTVGLNYSSGMSALWPILIIIIVCGLIVFIAYKKFFE